MWRRPAVGADALGAEMIVFITTAEHQYTHSNLVEEAREVPVRLLTYDQVLAQPPHAEATYVFTDADRLPAWAVEAAAGLYRRLRDQGNRVLNDPARLLSRYGLLRRLQRDGFNRFNAYRAEECVAPSRWPVFLRTEGNHGGALTGLLADQYALDGAVCEAVARGYPISNLLIVEYVGEEVRPGLFRKMSVFKVGDRLLGYWCVHQSDWQVKQGTHGIATPELYEEEFQLVANDGYADVMAPVFDKAGVDYGRIDFSLLNGRPQVFEINTNPNIHLSDYNHPSPRRVESCRLFKDKYIAALQHLDDAAHALRGETIAVTQS